MRRIKSPFTLLVSRKGDKGEPGEPGAPTQDLRGVVRMLTLFSFFSLMVIVALSVVVSDISDTVHDQKVSIDRTDKTLQKVTGGEAGETNQVIIYKILLAQCEGRVVINPDALAITGDNTTEACADRLFFTKPLLPEQAPPFRDLGGRIIK